MKSEKDFLELIRKTESLIRTYEFKQAIALVESISLDDIPNSRRPKIASLAKRLGLAQMGLKILWPQIYEQRTQSPEVILEFASCLRKAGLCRQAHLWLKRMPSSDAVLRELAFVHIPLWEYAEARDTLADVLSRSTPDEPMYSVLKVNLAACHLFLGEMESTLKHLGDIEKNQGYGNRQIYINSIEMHAQCLMQEKKPLAAFELLESILSKGANEVNLTYLFLKKWQFLARLAETKDANLTAEFVEVQNIARKLRHWETLRDLDYQSALIKGDFELMTKVYFGTPYDSYKRRILSKVAPNVLPNTYVWQTRPGDSPPAILDSFLEAGAQLGMGKVEHRLLLLLLSDQYKPLSVSKIFDELYRDELYDPFTSENRVHTLVKSLRKNLANFPVPVELASTVAGYRIRPSDKQSFRVYGTMAFASLVDFYKALIGYAFGTKIFSRNQLEELLGLSPAQGQGRIKELMDAGVLTKRGAGPSTRYSIPTST